MQLTPDVIDGKDARQRLDTAASFQLKGSVASLAVLRLLSPDLERLDRQLAARVAQLPRFLYNAPVVIDFEALGERSSEVALDRLVELLRRHQLVPVAVRNLDEADAQRAADVGLGTLQPGAQQLRRAEDPEPAANGATEAVGEAVVAPPSSAMAPPVSAETSSAVVWDEQPTLPAARLYAASREPHTQVGSGAMDPLPDEEIVHELQEEDLEVISVADAGVEVIRRAGLRVDGAVAGPADAAAAGEWRAEGTSPGLDIEPLSSFEADPRLDVGASWSRRRQVAKALVAGAGALAVLLLAGYALRVVPVDTIGAAAANDAPDSGWADNRIAASPAPVAQVPAPVEPAMVRILIKVIPDDATVSFGGRQVANPFRAEIGRRTGSVEIIASAPGYQPRRFDVPLTESSGWVIALERSVETPASPAADARRPRARTGAEGAGKARKRVKRPEPPQPPPTGLVDNSQSERILDNPY